MLKIKAYTAYYLLKHIYGYNVTIKPLLDGDTIISYSIVNDFFNFRQFEKLYPQATLSICPETHNFKLEIMQSGKTKNHEGKMFAMFEIWNKKHYPHINKTS